MKLPPSKPKGPELTFARLDTDKGHKAPTGQSPLEQWYRRVRTKPIAELDADDVARALRQSIHVAAVAPRALQLLQKSPLVGDYPGEVIVAFAKLPAAELDALPKATLHSLAKIAKALVAAGPNEDLDAPELRKLGADLKPLLHRLATATPLQVIAEAAGHEPYRFTLGDDALTVGSGPDATLRFDFPNSQLAKRHAQLTLAGTTVHVELFGHAGVLNDRPAVQSFELKPGDRLQLGPVRVTLSS